MSLLAIAVLSAITIINMPEDTTKGTTSGKGSQGPLFSFGIITDVQYCNCEPAGTRFYKTSPARLREALSSLKSNSVDFVFNLGDLIDRNYESFKPMLRIIDSSGIKTYHLLGNHDFNVENRFKKKIPLPIPEKEGYYSFVHQNFRFIVLNGNELSTYATTSKSSIKEANDYISALRFEGSPNSQDWNGGMSPQQLKWLESQLDEATVNSESVFIFSHFPVYPENEHNLLNYKDVLYLLKKYTNIIAYFAGHNHAGNYGNQNKTHFVTLRGMVETDNTNSFSWVEVFDNKIWIHGSGREKSVILAY
jgi:manganese-dependent ADP-ribose/CDP-alcohol diphosphatase